MKHIAFLLSVYVKPRYFHLSIIVFICFFPAFLFAQTGIVGKASSEASVTKGNTSVQYSTGILNYSIPLVSDRNLVNIGLTYAARGIKVDQRPSPAGLGWNLSGVGVISRSVRGRINDESMQKYGKVTDTVALENFYSENQLKRFNSNEADGESDLFTLSCNTISLKFILKNISDSIVAVPLEKSNVKIEVEGGIGLNGFKVTDENGNQYFFREKERLAAYLKNELSVANSTFISHITSAWYLSKLRMYNGEEVYYEYMTDYVSETRQTPNQFVRYANLPYKEVVPNMDLIGQIESKVAELEAINQENSAYRAALNGIYDRMRYLEYSYKQAILGAYMDVKQSDTTNYNKMASFNSIAEATQYYLRVKQSLNVESAPIENFLNLNEVLAFDLNAAIMILLQEYYSLSDAPWFGQFSEGLSMFRPLILKKIITRDKEFLFDYKFSFYKLNDNYSTDSTGQIYLSKIDERDRASNYITSVYFNHDDSDHGYLQGLCFGDTSAGDSYRYSFDYFEDTVLLMAQDYWGFYNGKKGNFSYLPADPYYTTPINATESLRIFNAGNLSSGLDYELFLPDSIGRLADRYPDSMYVIARSLRKVHLPEGGFLEFYYEPNNIHVKRFSGGDASIQVGGIRIKEIIYGDSLGNLLKKSFKYEFPVDSMGVSESTGSFLANGHQSFDLEHRFGEIFEMHYGDCYLSNSLYDLSPYLYTIGNENLLYHYVEENIEGFGTTGYKYFNFGERAMNRGLMHHYYWLEDLLLAKVNYDTADQIVSIEKYAYQISSDDIPSSYSNVPLDFSLYFSGSFVDDNTYAFTDTILQAKPFPIYYDSLQYAQIYYDQDQQLGAWGTETFSVNIYDDFFVPNILPRTKGLNDNPIQYIIKTGGKVLPQSTTTYLFNGKANDVTSSPFPRNDRPYYFEWFLQGGESYFVKEKTNYYYDNPLHTYPTKIEKELPDGKRSMVKNKYVLDYADSANSIIPKLKQSNQVATTIEQQQWIYDPLETGWSLLSGKITAYEVFAKDTLEFVVPMKEYITNLSVKINPGVGTWEETVDDALPYQSIFHENEEYYSLEKEISWDSFSDQFLPTSISTKNSGSTSTYSYDIFTGRLNATVVNGNADEVLSVDLHGIRNTINISPTYKFFKKKVQTASYSELGYNLGFLERDCRGYAIEIADALRRMERNGIMPGAGLEADSLFYRASELFITLTTSGSSFQVLDSLYDVFEEFYLSNTINATTRTICAPYFDYDKALNFLLNINYVFGIDGGLLHVVFEKSAMQLFEGDYYETFLNLESYVVSGKRLEISAIGQPDIPVKIYFDDSSSYATTISLNTVHSSGIRSTLFDVTSIPRWQQAVRMSFRLNNSSSLHNLLVVPEHSTFQYSAYNADGKVSYTYDQNYSRTSYEYDHRGRLSMVRDNDGRIIRHICYNYANQPTGCKMFYNQRQSAIFTRDNCPSGLVGQEWEFVVNAGKYPGLTQREADSLALRELNLWGQYYANIHGECDTSLYYSIDASGYYSKQSCSHPETPSPMYVNMPAGSYTSELNQAHANLLAQQAAQNYANNYGSCIREVFDLTLTNATASGVTVYFYNIETMESSFFYISPGTGPGVLSAYMGAGYYNVEIVPDDSFLSYNVFINCAYSGYYSGGYLLYSVPLSSICKVLNIY